MELVLLVTSEMTPVPEGIEVVKSYGDEGIIPAKHAGFDDAMANQVRGHSMHLRGDKSAFIEWLKHFNGVWTCDSPGTGAWYVVHIKPELAA